MLRRSCRTRASGGGGLWRGWRGPGAGPWGHPGGGAGDRVGGTVVRRVAELETGPGAQGRVHQLRDLPNGCRHVLFMIVVPHPRMARVKDHDHGVPRIWKDRSRTLGHISAGPRAAGALIDAIYQPCCPRPLPTGHRRRGDRGPPRTGPSATPARPPRPGHPGHDHPKITPPQPAGPGGHGTVRQPLRDNLGGARRVPPRSNLHLNHLRVLTGCRMARRPRAQRGGFRGATRASTAAAPGHGAAGVPGGRPRVSTAAAAWCAGRGAAVTRRRAPHHPLRQRRHPRATARASA